MTIRFNCYALSSNQIDPEQARRNGIDGLISAPAGKVIEVDSLDSVSLRKTITDELKSQIDVAKRSRFNHVAITISHRDHWTQEDLKAVNYGLIDAAAELSPHPIDRAYPPPNV